MDQKTTPLPGGQAPEEVPKKRNLWAILRKWLTRLAILVLLILLVFQIPAVQNYLAQKVVHKMEESLGTEVTLDRVRVKWLDRLELNNLFIRDLHSDTLLKSGDITANFNLNPFVLWSRGLEIEALGITGARFNISRHENDSLSNINWAISKLLPAKDPTKEKKGLPFNLQELLLSDVLFSQLDSTKGKFLSIYVPEGQIWVENLDLANERIDINTVNIQEPKVMLNNWIAPLADSLALDSLLLEEVQSSDLMINIGEFRLEGGQFILHNFRKAPVKTTAANQLDLKHLDLYDIQVEIDSFHYHRDTFTGRVNWLAAKDESGFKLQRLSSQEALVSPREVQLNGLSIITPTSRLGDTLHFKFREYLDWESFEDKVRMDMRFHKADVTLTDIMAFVPKLKNNVFFNKNRNTNLKIEGRFRGKVNSLRADDLKIDLADGTHLSGNFFSRNLTVPDELFLRLEVGQLRSRMSTLRQLIPNFQPPANFDNLGQLNFSGEFTGYSYDFVANGDLRTELGRATLDMHMLLNGGPETANYTGNINLIDFDLGGWAENPDLGVVNFASKIKEGYGLTGENTSAKLTAAIESFEFKGYNYENANITGELNQRFFNGDLSIQDENIDFSFAGELDFTDSIPKFDFKANVRRLALKPLNLSKQDLVIVTKADINLRDTKFSNVEGSAKFDDILFVKDKVEEYRIDFFNATSFFDDTGEKVFRLDSDIARGEVRGAFDINELPGSLSLFVLRNYPGFASRFGIKAPKRTPEINEFNFDFHIENSKDLNRLLSPKLGTLEGIDLNGRYNGVTDSLLVYLEMPYLEIGGTRLADIYVHIDALKDEGDLDIVIDSTIINGKPRFNTFTLLSILERDTLDFAINLSTDTPNIFDHINLNGLLFLPDSTNYQLQLRQSNLSLLQRPWAIQEDNKIVFGNGKIKAENFLLTNQEQQIKVLDHGERGLRFQFANFDFSFIDELWDYDQLNFAGEFDMLLQVDNMFKLEGINAAMACDSFFINKDNFGEFRLDANTKDIKSQLSAIINIEKDTTKLNANALVNLGDLGRKAFLSNKRPLENQKGYMDLQLALSGYPLDIAEYWLGAGLSETHGSFSANLNLSGLPKRLKATGYVDARDGGFTIDVLQTHYTFKKGLIIPTESLFDASNTVLYDKYGNSAVVTGGITHKYLREMGLGATLNTRRFLGLDLKKGDNDIFYGKALGAGKVEFSGDFHQPNVYVNATVADSTHIVIPITDQAEAQSLDFVKFVNKHKESTATKISGTDKIKGLNLEMDLHVTEVADLELIFDEQAGDILRGQGHGDLRIELPRAGEFEMSGTVEVTHGNYLFTLFDVINKDFRIIKGGTITWNRDPYNAILDIKAEYKDLKTSVSGFIQEYLVNAPSDLVQLASQSTNVNLTLKLKGELFKPDITFDIDFPDLNGQLGNMADNKLALIRRDQSELNRQVFGLIVVGQFLPSDLSISSNEVISNTVSEYLSNQVSLLVSQLFSEILGKDSALSSLDFEVAYNRYVDVQTFSDNKAVEFSLSSGYFNDRLKINLGGNLAFGDIITNNLGSGAFFGEDIVIEYALNDSRDLKIRLYERREQDISGGRRLEIGSGLSWRKEFNTFGEFWKNLKKKD